MSNCFSDMLDSETSYHSTTLSPLMPLPLVPQLPRVIFKHDDDTKSAIKNSLET